ncbi:hypothetical protein PVIIG_02320 [Plasmodium vivax India VII]|uniref:Phosphoglycerate mutase n=1 Tax=Plasmodium vivax India VII TaxID=1077284 RepID=A0A0J9S8N7_PLAVI|nr:hypothetical protein PVIIG_02320 [Plasmodium vivax India VII]
MSLSAIGSLIKIKLIIYCFKRLLLFNKYKHIQLEKNEKKKKKKLEQGGAAAGDSLGDFATMDEPVKNNLQTKTVYFIRHSESIWNSVFNKKITIKNFLNIFLMFFYEIFFIFSKKSSLIDSPLSKTGIQESVELSKFLKDSIDDKENTDLCGGNELMQLEYIDKATKEMEAFYTKLCDGDFDAVTTEEKDYVSICDDFYYRTTEEDKDYVKICDGDNDLSEIEEHFKDICDGYFDGLLYKDAKFVKRKIAGDDDYVSSGDEDDEDSSDDEDDPFRDSKSSLSSSSGKLSSAFGSQGNIAPWAYAKGPRMPGMVVPPGSMPNLVRMPGSMPNLVRMPGSVPNLVPLPGSMPNLVPLPGSMPNLVPPWAVPAPNLVPLPGAFPNLVPIPGSMPNLIPMPGSMPNLAPIPGSMPNLTPQIPGSMPNLAKTSTSNEKSKSKKSDSSSKSTKLNSTLDNLTQIPGATPSQSKSNSTTPNLKQIPGSTPNLNKMTSSFPNQTQIQGSMPNLTPVAVPGSMPNLAPIPGAMPGVPLMPGSLPNLAIMPGQGMTLPQAMTPFLNQPQMAGSFVNLAQNIRPYMPIAPMAPMVGSTMNLAPMPRGPFMPMAPMAQAGKKDKKKKDKKKKKKKKGDKKKKEGKKEKKQKSIAGELKSVDFKEEDVFGDEEDDIDEKDFFDGDEDDDDYESDSDEESKEPEIPVMTDEQSVEQGWKKPTTLSAKPVPAKVETTSTTAPATAAPTGAAKAGAAKVGAAKVGAAKVGAAKAGPSKATTPKATPARALPPKATQAKATPPKVEPKVEEPKTEVQKTVETKTSESIVTEPKVEEPGDNEIPQADDAASKGPALGRPRRRASIGSTNEITTSAVETPSTSSTVDTKAGSNDGGILDIPKKRPVSLRRMAMENSLRRNISTTSLGPGEDDFGSLLSLSSVGSELQDTSSIDGDEKGSSSNLDAFESGDSIATEDLEEQYRSENMLNMSVKEHIDVLNNTKYKSVVLCSDLRRAITSCFIALQDRFKTSSENVYVLKSLQELSRNADSITLFNFYHKYVTPTTKNYVSDDVDALIKQKVKMAEKKHRSRFQDTLSYIFGDSNNIFIIFGHSLWFLSFFKTFLKGPHKARNHKMRNSSVVVFNLSKYEDEEGEEQYEIEEGSVKVVFKGFEKNVYSKD